MANTITGRILSIGDIEAIPSKNGGEAFKKRKLVLNCTRSDFGQVYENYPSFEFSGKHVADVEQYKVGDIVTVSFALQGKKVQKENMPDTYFNTVAGYKIERWQRQSNAATSQPMPVAEQPQVQHQEATTTVQDNDLPF